MPVYKVFCWKDLGGLKDARTALFPKFLGQRVQLQVDKRRAAKWYGFCVIGTEIYRDYGNTECRLKITENTPSVMHNITPHKPRKMLPVRLMLIQAAQAPTACSSVHVTCEYQLPSDPDMCTLCDTATRETYI